MIKVTKVEGSKEEVLFKDLERRDAFLFAEFQGEGVKVRTDEGYVGGDFMHISLGPNSEVMDYPVIRVDAELKWWIRGEGE